MGKRQLRTTIGGDGGGAGEAILERKLTCCWLFVWRDGGNYRSSSPQYNKV